MAKTTKKEYPHSGHRKRLIEKIETFSLCDHELLEALLFNALPRQNTNELAHALIREFGSLEGVLSASMAALEKVDGVGCSLAAYIRLIGLIQQRIRSNQAKDDLPRKFDYRSFVPYVKRAYADMDVEVLDVYVLDDSGSIITRVRFSSTDSGKVEVYTQNLMRVFYAYTPSGIVLVHNHPCGSGSPSAQDDYMTAHCQKVCADNGIMFCDHIIYGQSGLYSYYLQEKLNKLGDTYEKRYEQWMKGVVSNEIP